MEMPPGLEQQWSVTTVSVGMVFLPSMACEYHKYQSSFCCDL